MKEMISEEDGSVAGNDLEKNHKRLGDQNNRDDVTATKRPKVERDTALPEFEENEDGVLEPVDGENMEVVRGESDPDENEDSLSEINENSDVSQNSISSSNNNTLDGRKCNSTLEGGQDPVLVPETQIKEEPTIVENGLHEGRRGSTATSTGKNRSIETNEDSSRGSTKENVKQETVFQRFQKEITDLTTLLLLKEKEWNAVLRLVKLKEIAFAQIQRRKDMDEILDSPVPSDWGTDFLQKLFTQISGEEIKTGPGETHVRNSIIETEKEVIELGKQISSNRVNHDESVKGETETLSGSDSSQVDSVFLASNALKSLVNRNKATLMSHSIPTNSTVVTVAATPGKIIGAGRQGPIVEVTSLIEDYRSRSQNDTLDKRTAGLNKQPLTPGTASTFSPLNMSPTICFTDVLSRLKKIVDKEKDSSCSTTTSTVSNNKTAPASKAKTSLNTNSNNASVSSGKSSVGTTLAKLLSSNNSGSGSRNADDTPTFSNMNKQASNNLTNSDKNLSLANLLASAKSRDDTPKKKADNQAVPLCQGCNANKAQFVCAGCANQWYCSRECQVAAWDEHSEICSG